MEPVRFQMVEENGQHVVHEIYKVVVHKFTISDSDDPEIYAAEPIWEWQQSEAGKFVMKYAVDKPAFHRHFDYARLGYHYAITAELEKKKYSEFLLRYGRHGNN